MKICEDKNRKAFIILGMALVLLAILCCVFAHAWNPNFVSMLSGLWSGIATVALGAIAYWQNKRYKEMSDRLDERQNAPEFFISTPVTDEEGFGSSIRNYIEVYGTKRNEPCLRAGRIEQFLFSSLDKPILHLRPTRIIIEGREQPLCVSGEDEINVYKPYSPFRIIFEDIDCDITGKAKAEIVFEYENIYAMKYQKIYSIDIMIKQDQFIRESWGVLSLAKKIDG